MSASEDAVGADERRLTLWTVHKCAAELLADTEREDNPEYCRALVELCTELSGMSLSDQRNRDETWALLKSMGNRGGTA